MSSFGFRSSFSSGWPMPLVGSPGTHRKVLDEDRRVRPPSVGIRVDADQLGRWT